MKERRIETMQVHESSHLEKIHEKFISGDILTQKDIAEMAELIVKSVQEKISFLKNNEEQKEVEIIIQVLQPLQILVTNNAEYKKFFSNAGYTLERSLPDDPQNSRRLSWLDEKGNTQSDILTEEDLEPFLQRIRLAVLDKLSGVLPENVTAQLVKKFIKNRVLELEKTGDFHKTVLRNNESPYGEPDTTELSHIEALQELHKIPTAERSPFVYFGIQSFDRKKGAIVVKGTDLDILEDIAIEGKSSLKKMINYFLDILAGHQFLIQHNLFLTDNALCNLGIEKSTDRGILFDFDGLQKKDFPARYVCHVGYGPPERLGGDLGPIKEYSIVYELGVSLHGLILLYINRPEEVNEEIKLIKSNLQYFFSGLVDQMTDENPEKRPSLQEVEKSLREIINLDK